MEILYFLTITIIGDTTRTEEAIHQSTRFLLSCYGFPNCKTLSEAREKSWTRKISRSTASAPKLESLPPTTETFRENAMRAHLQVSWWKSATLAALPDHDACQFGWTLEDGQYRPTQMQPRLATMPPELMKIMKCGCASATPCNNRRCSCVSAGMACTEFCGCIGDCHNSSQEPDEKDT